MTLKSHLLGGLILTLGACAAPPEYPAFRFTAAEQEAVLFLDELSRVATLSAEQRRREVAELEGMRRLGQAKRFQLAALLEREDSVEALERSLRNLNAMSDVDTGARPLLDLMKKSLKARIELKQLTAHAQELEDKLEQIKVLEKSLQQRNGPSRTP